MLLLRRGNVVDGSAREPFPGSVLIDNDRISQVAEHVVVPPDCRTIDCEGLVIAPGFIDLHSHSDLQVLEGRTEKLKQGVTSEVVGNCGFSPFPFSGDDPDALREFGSGILGKPDGWGWHSAQDYFEALASAQALTKAFPLLGHGSLRIAVHGLGQDPLSTLEMDRMCGIIAESLEAGCVGVSTGLMYAPGSGADTRELERICEVVARKGKLYTSHIRGYGSTLLEAIEEQITAAKKSGCRLQISHLQAAGRENWALQAPALERIEMARASGLDIEFDIYPYQCGSTVLTQLLPLWSLDGGVGALLERIADKKAHGAIIAELNARPASYWSDVTLSSVESGRNASLIGQTVAQAAEGRRQSAPELILDVLAEEEGAVNIISFNQSESNLRQLLSHSLCSVITDGFYVKGSPHPRLHGTYPELLGKLVRDLGWLTLPDAIHKSTAKPAARLQISDLGMLQNGYLADVVVFNPGKIASRATYERPLEDPIGIHLVVKRGQIVLEGESH